MKTTFDIVYENMDNFTSLNEFFFKKKPKKTPEELQKELDDAIESLYDDFKKWWEKPYRLGDGYDNDILIMAKCLKISEKELCERVMKFIKIENVSLFTGNNKNDTLTLTKVFKSGKLYRLLDNDDYMIAINPSDKMIYEIQFDSDITIERFNYIGNTSLQFDDSDIPKWISKNNIRFKK